MSYGCRLSVRAALAVHVVLFSVLAFPVVGAAQPSPIASVSGVPAQHFIGEPLTFTVTFDNGSATQTGYGPYVDLVLPATGADGAGAQTDDGITFVGATYLGSAVTATVLTFDGAGHATHPYARDAANQPIIVSGTAGDQLVVLQLPFGSFTPDQPPVDLLVTATLSPLADANTLLTMQARGGFRYGADALDNPASDPSIIGSFANASTTPTVLRLKKTYLGPEDETATGPNFPRQYLIEVDVASGQTVTNLDLTDILPSNLQFVGVDSTTIRGSVTATTAINTPSTTTPGGTLTRRFASVTGTTATNDATMLFTFYVPRTNASSAVIIDANSGDDVQSTDDASTQGTWTPVDGRDAPGPVSSDVTPADHILTDKSIAIQKSVAIVNDTGVTGYSPGDVLEYTLTFQVSDYFAFQNLIATDVLGDGLRPDGTFTPTLRVTQHGNTSSGNIALANYNFAINSPGDGTTTGTFSVSAEMLARALSGQLLGGCVPDGGTGGPLPDCAVFNGGGTTVTLKYRAIIQNDYTDNFPSGDPSVDEGDVLSNNVSVVGDVLDDATLAPTGSNEADTSHADVQIQRGQLFKSIYAINGNTTLPSPLRISPGDTVTYELRLTLPTSDVEPLTITDFLPLPIFNATTVTNFDPTVSATAPPSGWAKFGPLDTFKALSSIVPSMSTDATSNSVIWQYPQFDSPGSPSTAIDLLFTVTVTDDPFADGLFLTNQANAKTSSTQLNATTRDAIVQVQLAEPDLLISKGVVATDNASGSFTPSVKGPVAFTAPGTAGYRGAGSITSTNLAANPINSNLSNVDAGDLVTFAIVLENRGNGVHGAYDVRFNDSLPTGFSVPAAGAGLNLKVTDGTGAPVAFSNINGGLFDPTGGIELTDTAEGAIVPFDATSGANIIVITYDLQADAGVQSQQALTNTATLFHFAGTEGGPDFTSTDRSDTATVTIAAPVVTKSIVTTNQAHTSGSNVAIGEQVQYSVVVRVPEGVTNAATLVDTLPLGLAVVSLDGLSASSGALTSSSGAFGAILGGAAVTASGAGADNAGRVITINLGNLTNNDTDNTTPETLTLLFTAVVINGGSNDRGDTRTNSAQLSFSGGGPVSGTSGAVTIVEPTLQVAKSALPATGDAGDTVTFTVTLSHAAGSNATAFNVTLADVLPAGVTYVNATNTGGVAPDVFTPGAGFSATWNSFAVGATSTFQIQATLDASLGSGQVITNQAASTWTSLPGTVTTTQSPFNTVATERTGNTGDPGGTENDYRATGSANVTGAAATPTKSIISTSLASTSGNNLAIGEQVQYQVQIAVPEGTNTSVTLVDTLDPGLAFVSFDSITATPTVTTNVGGGFATVLATPTVANVGGGAANAGRRVTFNLGTITNSDNNNASTETITFVYTAVAVNTSANLRGGTHHNTAVWTASGNAVSTSAPDVTIVEPTLQVVKTVAPASGDAGGTVTFTLVVSHTGASNEDAYDVTLTDTIPAGLTYVGSSVSNSGGVAPTTLGVTSGTLTATFATLAVGQTSTIQFQATLDSAPPVTPGQVITNTATLTWSSLPGNVTTTQSTMNTLATERTGSTSDPGGAVNNYTASGSKAVTVNASSLAGFVYIDTNNDGVKSVGENGISGATVRLSGTDHLGNAVALTTTTIADGSYSFTGLRPGTYTISETQPAGYLDGRDSIGTPTLGATAGDDLFTTIVIPAGSSTNAIDFNFGELPSADLSITKRDTPDPVLAGGALTYTLTVVNNGPNAAPNAVLTDPLPGGTTFTSLSAPGGWSCTAPSVGAAGVISCSNTSFAPGTATFTLTVATSAGLPAHSLLRNVATITSSAADGNPTNNRAEEPTLVAAATDADLEVTKTDSPDPVVVGQTVTYIITVRNHGPATTDATVTESLPAALTFVSATPSSGSCVVGASIVCSIPGMAANATATITLAATAMTPGVATNNVTVSGTAPDPNPANDHASEPTTIVGVGETDLAITKSGPLTIGRGNTLTYTIVVKNNGPNAANTVQVDDPISLPGLTFVANDGACTSAFPCALGTIASGATRTIVSTWSVNAAYSGANPIVNTATVSTSTTDADPTNNTATAQTLVADPSAADLSITKVDSPDAAVAGTQVTYTLVVTNRGPGTAMGASVTDTLPAGVTLVSSTASQGSCSGTTSVICSLGTMANGANATIAITIQTSSALPATNPISNTATVTATSSDPDPSNNSATEPTTIVAQTDVQITKSAPASIKAGQALAFTIVVTNAGPSDALNVIVSDTTPSGLTFTSNTGACTTAFPCALGTVPAGQSRTITATYAVPSSYTTPDPILNTASVTSDTTETNATNNSAQSSTSLVLDADLGITKSGPATIQAGQAITYTITVTNHGPTDAANVVVSDPTPVGLTFTSNSGACTTVFPCSLGSMANGQTRTITSTFQVPSNYSSPASITNTTTVSAVTPDSNSANNSSTAMTTLGAPSADLAITKTGPATAIPGNSISYTITVTNNGPSDAAAVTVNDATPTGLTFTSATPSAGSCSGTAVVICNLGTVPASQARTVVVIYGVPPSYTTPDPISNTATVSSTTNDPDPTNNSATALTSVGADLSLTKVASPAPVAAGDLLTFTIVSTNLGARDAQDLVISDAIPTGTAFVSASTSTGGICTTPAVGGTGMVSCTWTGLTPASTTRTLTLIVRVNASAAAGSIITNTAITSSSTNDPHPTNNTATSTTTVTQSADLAVTKVVDHATPNVADAVLFTVTLRNNGPSNTTGVAVVDALPAGLTLLTATPSVGSYDASNGRWTVGALAVDGVVTLALQARVDASGGMTNTATITASDQADPNTSNNTAGAAINVPAAADLQVQKTVDRAAASVGTEVTFTISVHNAGPDAATGVVVADPMPPGLTLIGATPSAGAYDAATGAWTIGSLALNATATMQVTAAITQEGTITNTAHVTQHDQVDPAPGNNAAGISVNGLAADLQVVKTVDNTSPNVGDRVTFTIAVTNNGPGEATGVRVRDLLPRSLMYLSSTASQGMYVPETSLWTVGTLATPGTGGVSSATLQIVALVIEAGGNANVATVSGGDQPDPNPANDRSSVPFAGIVANLQATLRFVGDINNIGGPFAFYLTATNVGSTTVTGPLTFIVPFPEEIRFTTADRNVTCQTLSHVISCTLPNVTMTHGDAIELGFFGVLERPLPPGLKRYATIIQPLDRDPRDNVSEGVLVSPPEILFTDLSVSQTSASTVQTDGTRQITYTISIKNGGPDAASGVTFQDALPPGLTLVSIASSQGSCYGPGSAGSAALACDIGAMSNGQVVTVTLVATAAVGQQIAHMVSVAGRECDANPTNNAALDVTNAAPALAANRDTDGDGMPDVWESTMGLDPSVNDATGDADHDGVSNIDEYRAGTHPRGLYRQYFAEGASNQFFGTMFSLVNPDATRDAAVAIEMMRDSGQLMTQPMTLGAMKRADATAAAMLGGWEGSFATLIESDRPIASDRLTWWDTQRSYGSGLESGQPAPSTRWLFAEGATHGFQLFYLLQNPDMTQAADVTIRYLLPSGPPLVKTYQVAPHSRLTILANEIPGLEGTDLSAEVLSSRPIVAERSMYRNTSTQLFAAGHVGAGAPAPSATWFFAEGATGDFFNLYLLLGNPNAAAASVDVRYLLPDGQTITRTYVVAGNTRRTVDVANEDARLASTSVGMAVSASLPIVAERAMWWPGPRLAPEWYESHVVLGATEAGTRWAVASGAAGGVLAEQTFVLVANMANVAGRVRVTVILDDGSTRVQELPIAATARMTLEIGSMFGEAFNHAFSVIVDSLGTSPVPIVVEGSRYGSPDGQLWGAGASALATRLQ